ncbi:MAG: Fic family protein [Balneolaceae bacterium]|nr:MAG: Fic family protein [Balneolaceae bacterium]
MEKKHEFKGEVTGIRGFALPEDEMILAGYSALIYWYNLAVPLPGAMAAVSKKHRKYSQGRWNVFRANQKPDDSLFGHLVFALKYEGVDLFLFKKLFSVVARQDVEGIVTKNPTSSYARRIWFFFEWLSGKRLDLDDAKSGNYVDALNPELQYPGPGSRSPRHRVNNNLPGVPGFCPLIRRTEKLEQLRMEQLDKSVRETIGAVHADLLARAAAFLLLKDSKASYAIEGESPPHSRAERWGRAIGQAGQNKLTNSELLRLQEIVIEDRRFVRMGWRTEEGFVGVHDRISQKPIPDHISAKPDDLIQLMDSLLKVNEKLSESDFDAVMAAALVSFGFVFIHPFVDGNGRIHRYLVHHVLAEKGFAPEGMIFPVSAVILGKIADYKKVLESYSRPRLEFIDWEPTPDGNVRVNNDTVDLYRYFDATQQAEFLYECVRETVHHTLPEEVRYLEQHDKMRQFISDHFDMPDKVMENLIGFLRQNNGYLSRRAREKEFKALTTEEIALIEKTFREIFRLD